MEQIGLSKEEYFHLKAIALVNCNCIVEEPGRLQDVKDALVLSLFDLVAAVRYVSSVCDSLLFSIFNLVFLF